MPVDPVVYFDKYAAEYSLVQSRRWNPANSLPALIDPDQLAPAQTVLDLGCGPGLATVALAKHVGHVVALDAAPAMLLLAQSLATNNGAPNVSFVLGDANALPFAAESFDVINSQSVLQFVDLNRALPAIHFALRPGGIVAISHRAVATGRPVHRLIDGIQRAFSAIRSSTRLALAQGPQAGMQHVRARLRHHLFSWRYDMTRLDTGKASALYQIHLPQCTLVTKPGSRLLLVRWRKPRR